MFNGCSVCLEDQGIPENPLVYCDSCELAVHSACYGIVDIPEGNWYCRRCELPKDKQDSIKCELCPAKGGALKQTETGLWAHVVCGLYIPEVRFGDPESIESIEIKHIPKERFNKTCYICQEKTKHSVVSNYGALMDCHKLGCKQSFHVTCAQASGLLCEEENGAGQVTFCGYCKHHFRKHKTGSNKKPSTNTQSITSTTSTATATPSATNCKNNNTNNNNNNNITIATTTTNKSPSPFPSSASNSSHDDDNRCNATTDNDKNSSISSSSSSTSSSTSSSSSSSSSTNSATSSSTSSSPSSSMSTSSTPSLTRVSVSAKTNNISHTGSPDLEASSQNAITPKNQSYTNTTTKDSDNSPMKQHTSTTNNFDKSSPTVSGNTTKPDTASTHATSNPEISTQQLVSRPAINMSKSPPPPASISELNVTTSNTKSGYIKSSNSPALSPCVRNNNNNNPATSPASGTTKTDQGVTRNSKKTTGNLTNRNATNTQELAAPNLNATPPSAQTGPQGRLNSEKNELSKTMGISSSSLLSTVRPLESATHHTAPPSKNMDARSSSQLVNHASMGSSGSASSAQHLLGMGWPVASSATLPMDTTTTLTTSTTRSSPTKKVSNKNNTQQQPTVPPLVIQVPQTSSSSKAKAPATTKTSPRKRNPKSGATPTPTNTENGSNSSTTKAKPEPKPKAPSKSKKTPASSQPSNTPAKPEPKTKTARGKSAAAMAAAKQDSAVPSTSGSGISKEGAGDQPVGPTSGTIATTTASGTATKRKSRSASQESAGSGKTAAAPTGPSNPLVSPPKRQRRKKGDPPPPVKGSKIASDSKSQGSTTDSATSVGMSEGLHGLGVTLGPNTTPLMINTPMLPTVGNRLAHGVGSLDGHERWFSPTISPYPGNYPTPGADQHQHGSNHSLSRSSLSRLFTASSTTATGLLDGPANQHQPPLSGGGLTLAGGPVDDAARAFEELRENTWSHLSKCVLEQAQHFDIPSLIGTLYTLRTENEKLTNKVRDLTLKRDQLVAVNARLDLPGPLLTQHLNQTSPNFSSVVGSLSSSPRNLPASSPGGSVGMSKQSLVSIGPYSHHPVGPPSAGSLVGMPGSFHLSDRHSPMIGGPGGPGGPGVPVGPPPSSHGVIKSSSISAASPPVGSPMAHSNNRSALITLNPPFMGPNHAYHSQVSSLAQLGPSTHQQASSYYPRQ